MPAEPREGRGDAGEHVAGVGVELDDAQGVWCGSEDRRHVDVSLPCRGLVLKRRPQRLGDDQALSLEGSTSRMSAVIVPSLTWIARTRGARDRSSAGTSAPPTCAQKVSTSKTTPGASRSTNRPKAVLPSIVVVNSH